MKKSILLSLLVAILTVSSLSAQKPVIDVTAIGTLWANHSVQVASLKQIQSEQKGIKKLQSTINIKLIQIKALQQTAYESLAIVQKEIKNGKNIIYAGKVSKDIVEYQTKMMDYANGNPVLYGIALKTEIALADRTIDLFLYLANAVKGGKKNLMSNMDRMRIIQNVLDELKIMRGLAYGIYRKVRVASYGSAFKHLLNEYDVGLFGVPSYSRRIMMRNAIKDLGL